jgi:hypothetical protein
MAFPWFPQMLIRITQVWPEQEEVIRTRRDLFSTVYVWLY